MSNSAPQPAQSLGTPVQYLKGVGPERAELLRKLGLNFASDVLFFFPRDYQDFTDRRDIDHLEEGKPQSVEGIVEEIKMRTSRAGRTLLGVLIRSGDGYLRAMWFNQPFMRKNFFEGQRVIVSGKPKNEGLMWQMTHPQVETLADEEEEPAGKILPVYSLTEGLRQRHVRKIVRAAIEQFADQLEEVFPEEFRKTHRLAPIREALQQIHFPDDADSLAVARRRFIYQELFILQLALAVKRRRQTDNRRSPNLEATAPIDARIRRLFPFDFTEGQKRAIEEIAKDMQGPLPMNRLLQGDVGSGKTAAAVYAMLLAVAHGYQAAMMAPTEVLARQHARTLEKLLADSRVRRAQLIGGMPSAEREETVRLIAAGEVDIVIGTQAMIQDDVTFAKLGLTVIDEQHKFGVRQRATLKSAGLDPHYLVMTATPIPRTMALTLFGDLEVSTIDDSPPGRQKVRTYWVTETERERWWEFYRKKLREGRQGYVIAPLVDESERVEATSLQETFEALCNGELADFRVGWIHGRMTPPEKDAAMESFRSGETQVLVSTSVVEVGVDVSNAVLMTIESGERFGLAQLHQLRGRICRGKHPGFCAVFGDPQTSEGIERLKAFVSTTDGFKLAEVDFRLRGPGEFFGSKQHGMPPFYIADLLRDQAELLEARHDAQELVAGDPGLANPEHALLRRMTLARYGKALDLGDVG